MEIENLSFKIKLSGSYWDKRPQFSISINNTLIKQSFITADSGVEEVIQFDYPLTAGSHSLKIRLENKEDSDTVKDVDDSINYTIINDMLLNIHDIEIDNISIGKMLWDCEFILDRPVYHNGNIIEKFKPCVNLGCNGTYMLHFNSPLYNWLLENL